MTMSVSMPRQEIRPWRFEKELPAGRWAPLHAGAAAGEEAFFVVARVDLPGEGR
jgi:hypothetical protein